MKLIVEHGRMDRLLTRKIGEDVVQVRKLRYRMGSIHLPLNSGHNYWHKPGSDLHTEELELQTKVKNNRIHLVRNILTNKLMDVR